MNERIKELAFRAGFIGESMNPIIGTSQATALENFAELIVRECINKIESKRSSGENIDTWTITRDMAFHEMKQEIAEHFGVGRKQEIIEFCGVPLVRVAYVDSLWQVQMRDSEDSQNWFNVGNGFQTSDEAVAAAPELCEF